MRKQKDGHTAFTTPARKRPRNDSALPTARLDPSELTYSITPTKPNLIRPPQHAPPCLTPSSSSTEDDGDEDGGGDDEYLQTAVDKQAGSDDEASIDSPRDEAFLPRTPSRRKRGVVLTPRAKRSTGGTKIAAPTPHSKAALRARATRKRTMAIRPPPPDATPDLDVENLPDDPWLRAMHVLHVASRPEAHLLPCREEEYARILRAVEELLEEGSGGCICA